MRIKQNQQQQKIKTPLVLGRSSKEQEAIEICVYQVAFSCVFSKKCCRICKSRGIGASVEETAPPAYTWGICRLCARPERRWSRRSGWARSMWVGPSASTERVLSLHGPRSLQMEHQPPQRRTCGSESAHPSRHGFKSLESLGIVCSSRY